MIKKQQHSSHLFPVGEDIDSTTLRQHYLLHEILEDAGIVRHQPIDDDSPETERQQIHLEELSVQEQLVNILSPSS